MTPLESIVAMRRLGKLTAGDLVAWAVEALSLGEDSDSLRRLAGLDLERDVRLADAEGLFQAAVAEGAVAVPGEDSAIRAYVRSLVRDIVDGKAAPQAQVARIHAEVLSPLDHPRDLMVWCYVGDGMHPRGEWSLNPDAMLHWAQIPEPDLDRVICELAAWYLAQTGAA